MRIVKSRLELYVENYLKLNSIRMTTENTNLLKKALVYIEDLLEGVVCDYNDPIVFMHTMKDNQFTRTVYNMVMNMSRNGNRKSLQRTINLLRNKIEQSCC